MNTKTNTFGSEKGAFIPESIHFPEHRHAICNMKAGEYGWVSVWADEDGKAFVYGHEAVRDSQGENWPHLLAKTDSGYTARLLTQRVQRLHADVKRSKAVIPVMEVEL